MKCNHCRIGRLTSVKMPYITFLDDQMMVVPNVSAYRCDMCGEVLFNEGFLEALQYVLDRLTETEYPPETAEWLALNEQLGHWQPSGRMS
ncbi:MAG: YgiT-type zinc finger protein [Anaerolineae bacterium]|nr:YgiT-type zinc finger protein [Anaerolineae bacterium]